MSARCTVSVVTNASPVDITKSSSRDAISRNRRPAIDVGSAAAQLIACEDMPLRWRRPFALTIYFNARRGEVGALGRKRVELQR